MDRGQIVFTPVAVVVCCLVLVFVSLFPPASVSWEVFVFRSLGFVGIVLGFIGAGSLFRGWLWLSDGGSPAEQSRLQEGADFWVSMGIFWFTLSVLWFVGFWGLPLLSMVVVLYFGAWSAVLFFLFRVVLFWATEVFEKKQRDGNEIL